MKNEHTKHTPGPWTIKHPTQKNHKGELMHDFIYAGYPSSYRGDICSLNWQGGDAARVAANARLIASAPELLSYLSELSEAVETLASLHGYKRPECLPYALKAIAKAEGTTE